MTKFFTNKENDNLETRLQDILRYHKPKFLEFLIAYFRMSGFKKIAGLLGGVEKARILVGINVDALTLEAKKRGSDRNIFKANNAIDQFHKEQVQLLQDTSTPYTEEIDRSIELLANYLANKKVEIRIYPDKNIHAKFYILRDERRSRTHKSGKEYIGAVIIGSSNLTASGLKDNYEFNVELRDHDDIAFALNEFEELWKKSIEITENDIDVIIKHTYLRPLTPYELYIKFLMEYFEDRVDLDPNYLTSLPKGFKKLAYQIDAVKEGVSKIKKHGGFFLSDVVGLGKTVTAAM
ncbi:MAG: hypothetical protein C6I00_05170, partial [Nitratiruptor sp.]|nr:hypothetical protein [Nitratiruptor sp.]NPA83489.1 hypothetical protein [Campylobacterota bacterium]